MIDAAQVEEHLDGCGVCFSLVAELARADPDESDPTRMLTLHDDDHDRAHADEHPATSGAGSEVRLWGLGRLADPGEDDDEGERTLLGPLMPAEPKGPPPRTPTAPPVAAPPTQLGRYTILHRLGAGAMGVVYAAVDRELGRRVALKLIEATGPDAIERGARLLREAQALARLAHPHVVTVFDAGRVDGQVFVSMELVTGVTLREWLHLDDPSAGPPRAWREILAVFRQAGAGLAAAHAAGIIHRDFKPSNVLVDEQGRARVVDFGLARALDPVRDDAQTVIRALPIDPSGTGSGVLARSGAELSRSDVAAGTPAYMAPEQYDGLGDARIDQFGFCVALYEALFGRRPFEGRTAEQLLARINTAVPPEIPRPSDVPDWLARIVVRGLSRDPDRRFAGMGALLDAIEAGERRGARGRRIAIGAAGVAAVAMITAAVIVHERPHPCDDARAELAGIWDEPARAILAAKIAAVGAPFGADAWTQAQRHVERWSDAWVEATTAVCRRHADQPDLAVRDQSACLEQRRTQLRALTESWAVADRSVVEHLVDGAQWLAPVEACVGAAPRWDPELFDPGRRVALRRIEEALVAVRAAAATGAHLRGVPLGQATLALTVELGEQHAAVGEAHLVLGEQLLDAGRTDEGNAHIDAALQSSITRDDPAMLRDAAAAAARGAVAARRDPTQVLQLVAIGRAALGRTADDDAAATLDLAEAAAQVAAGQAEAASVALGTALERRIAARGESDLRVAEILDALGAASVAARRLDDALAHQRRALAIREDLLGAAHPRVAASCAAVAAVLVAHGRADEARAFAERALSIQERAFGAQDPRVADALSQLGAIEAELGHIDLALASHRRALAIREQSADVPELARALNLLGSTLVTLGRWDEADAVLHRALELGTTGIGARPLEVATTRFLLGRTAHGRGDFARAILAFTAAFESRRMLDEGTTAAITQVWLARAQRDSGDLEHAQASARAALARLDPPLDPDAWAHARLVVADVLWAQGETGAAVAGVTEAIDLLRASAISPPSAVAMLEAWRTARSAPEATPEPITIDP